MDRTKLFKISFLLSVLFLLLAGLLKLMDINEFALLLKIGAIISVVYIVIGILSILESAKKTFGQKIIWILGFIFLSVFTGVFFYQTQTKKAN